MEKIKKNKATLVLWIIIIFLMSALAWQCTHPRFVNYGVPMLGTGNEKIYDGDIPKEGREKGSSYVAVSVPSSFRVINNETQISVKNTGKVAIVPSVSIKGKEVYRSSKVLEPGKTLATVIPVSQGADKCVTQIEAVDGGKFTVTSTLER